MLSRAIDAALGVAVVVSLKYLTNAIEEVVTLGNKVDKTIVGIIASRIQSLHTKMLSDPCYYEMSTEERWVVIEPYFSQLFKETSKTIPNKRLDKCRNSVREAVTKIIHSEGI